MKKQDKIIAIGGVALIIVLAIVAVALLLNIDDGDSSIVKIKPQVTEVDLKEEMVTPVAIKVESDPDNEEQVVQEQVTAQAVASENKTAENEFYVKAACKEIRNNDNQMAELFGYNTDLRSMTGGIGSFSYEFARYEQAPSDIQEKEIAARAAENEDEE